MNGIEVERADLKARMLTPDDSIPVVRYGEVVWDCEV